MRSLSNFFSALGFFCLGGTVSSPPFRAAAMISPNVNAALESFWMDIFTVIGVVIGVKKLCCKVCILESAKMIQITVINL